MSSAAILADPCPAHPSGTVSLGRGGLMRSISMTRSKITQITARRCVTSVGESISSRIHREQRHCDPQYCCPVHERSPDRRSPTTKLTRTPHDEGTEPGRDLAQPETHPERDDNASASNRYPTAGSAPPCQCTAPYRVNVGEVILFR
jgi:hypothetical protein